MGERPLLQMPQAAPGAPQPPAEAPNRPFGADWLSDAADMILGGLGINNPFNPAASKATQAGGVLAAALPFGAVGGAARAARAAPAAAASLAPTAAELPGFASLADTLEGTSVPGVYRLKQGAQDRLAHYFKMGSQLPIQANWGGVTDELVQAFGGDRDAAMRWANAWGATSPNTSVPVNTKESIMAQLYNVQHPGRPLTLEEARDMSLVGQQGGKGNNITMAESKYGNINAAFAGDPLSGEKVQRMGAFMRGEPAVPIDVHAMYGLTGKETDLASEYKALKAFMGPLEGRAPAGRGVLNEAEVYSRYEAAIADTLKSIAPPGSSQNDVFATMWEGVRSGKGLDYQGSAIDILRKKGLLDVGAMLDPTKLTAALQSKGWSAAAIAAVLLSIHQHVNPPAAAGRGSGPGSGFGFGAPAGGS